MPQHLAGAAGCAATMAAAVPSDHLQPASSPLQERQTLEEAEGLLKKLGFKGSLFAAPPQQEQQQQGQQQPPEGQ